MGVMNRADAAFRYYSRRTGDAYINKFGENLDVDTTDESVWDAGGLYPWASLTTAQALEVVSGDDADTSDGTGGRTVRVYGLDADYSAVDELVSLSGTTPVSLTNTYLRVYRMVVLSAGTGGVNAGVVTLRLDGAGATVAQIQVGNNQTLMCVYTVPAGYTASLSSVYGSTSKGKDALLKTFVRPFGEVFQLKNVFGMYQLNWSHVWSDPLLIPEKSDIDIRSVSENVNTPVRAGFHLMLDKV